MAKSNILWFKDIDKGDGAYVGGKGANLGEMTRAGFPVPNGFVVTVHAYRTFLEASHIKNNIEEILHKLDINDSDTLNGASARIRTLITRSKFPQNIADEIIRAYFKLSGGSMHHMSVAVRSSATAEDLPGASFAGQQATFLNVRGEANLIEKVKEAWASLFTARAIFYRVTNKFDHFKVGIAIPVQRMIESEKSGIMFTINPVTNNKGQITIEAIFGLGEMIVQGAVTPDHYVVDKQTMAIVDRETNTQEKIMVRKGASNEIRPLSKKHGGKVKLTDKEILGLAEIGKRLEKHYFFPQDSEWAIEKGKIYIVQTRPVTTIGKESTSVSTTAKADVFARGDAASPGIATGPVKILLSAKEIHKIQSGDILVAEQTNPDFVPAMKKAVAIITERGGRTSHAAIVSRELGIPAVVGAKDIRKLLKDGMVLTVNGATGEIYKGSIALKQKVSIVSMSGKHLKTATKVYVNLAEPSRAEEISKMNADGVGLLRAEFMIADIGVHPKKLIADHKESIFINDLAKKLALFCTSFSPRPVVYRATDFKTNEYRNLKGGAAYEPEEPNPMLGFRGAARYIADSRVFEMELEAIKKVRTSMEQTNLHLMIPFVRTPKELMDVKKIIATSGLSRSSTFKLWLMCEIPTNVIRLNDFLDVGVDGVSVGSNDLTMLLLGTDRDNSEVAHDFSEMDASVLWAFEHVIKTCAKRGVTSSVCGQAPSDYPELVEKLVSWGITSVSVNPDAIGHVRSTIYEAEKKLTKKS
jgi:pyruvate,water dikinase